MSTAAFSLILNFLNRQQFWDIGSVIAVAAVIVAIKDVFSFLSF